MKIKKLLLGDEAFALAAINAGLSGAYGYPGTPSTEIMEFIQANPTAKEVANVPIPPKIVKNCCINLSAFLNDLS